MEPVYERMHPSTGRHIRPSNAQWDLWETIDSSNPADLRWKVTVAGITITNLNVTILCEAWPDSPTRKADSIIVCSTVGGTPHGANIQPTAIPLRIITPTGELVVRPALNFETGDIEPLRMFTTVDHGKAQVIYSGYNVSTGLFDILNMYTDSANFTVEPNGIGCIMYEDGQPQRARMQRAYNNATFGGVGQFVHAGWDTGLSEPMPIPINDDGQVTPTAGRGISAMGWKEDTTQRQVLRIDTYDKLETQDASNKRVPAVINLAMPVMNTIYHQAIAMPPGDTIKKLRFRMRDGSVGWEIGYDAALTTYETISRAETIEEEDLNINTADFYFRCPSAGNMVMEITAWG